MEAKDFKAHLVNDIIPFWNRMEDLENGGFYGYADANACPDKSSEKGCILNSRILWFYSSSYLLLEQDELLKKAEHAFRFLKDAFYDAEYGGVYWSVTYDGQPADTTKHTYNQAFSIYALSAYYLASKDPEALSLAYGLYHCIEERCRDEEGYFEAYNRDFTPASNEKLSENGVMADRTMNTLLHVLEAYTELYRAGQDAGVAKLLKEILARFRDKIYDPDKKSCKVFFDLDYRILIDLDSYGHNIEASWLLDRACQVLQDDACTAAMEPVILQLAEGAYENGIDWENNAMNNECEEGRVDRKKVWWVQAESVIGFYNAYQHLPEHAEYAAMSEKVWNYINTYVIDRKSGEWIEDIAPDNTADPTQALVHPWKCPYHNGRMCMEMIRRLS
jgi:mannobiose 2-epimerase